MTTLTMNPAKLPAAIRSDLVRTAELGRESGCDGQTRSTSRATRRFPTTTPDGTTPIAGEPSPAITPGSAILPELDADDFDAAYPFLVSEARLS